MRKVISTLMLILLSCFMLTACGGSMSENFISPIMNDTARFQYIGKSKVNQNGAGGNYGTADEIQYFVDNETQIIYIAVINFAANGTWAGFSPLIDIDGTYTTYEEFIAQKD